MSDLADEARGPTAGLLEAITHAADREWHRRLCRDFEMLPLGDAIDDGDPDRPGARLAVHASTAECFEDPTDVRAVIVATVLGGTSRSSIGTKRLPLGW